MRNEPDVQVNVVEPDAVPLVAVAVTVYVPAVVGVPLIVPDVEPMDRPHRGQAISGGVGRFLRRVCGIIS